MIRHFIDTLRKASQLAREERAAKVDAAERAAIAKAFNDRYCYGKMYVKDAPIIEGSNWLRATNRWMCPDCNQIHAPTKCSVFSGLQYPRCCSTAEGNRLSHGIKID